MKILFHISRDVCLVVMAKGVGAAIDSLLLVGLILRVQQGGGDALANGIVMVALAAPALVTMGWAGRLADRYDSRHLICVASVVQIFACALFVAPPTRHPGLALYATCFIFQTGYSIANPVWSALVPRIVDAEGVQRIVGAQVLISSVAAPAGAMAAGFVVARWGIQGPPIIAIVLLALMMACAVGISTRRSGGDSDSPLSVEASSGIRFIWRDRILAAVLVATLMTALVIQGVTVVEVFMAINVLHATPSEYGMTQVAFAVGVALASRVVIRLHTNEWRVRAIAAGFAGCALVCIAISGVRTWGLYLVLLGLLGLANSVANGALGPLFLLCTPDSHRGRVVASLNGLLSAATILAMCIGGVVGKLFGARHMFFAGGIFTLPAVVIIAVFAMPSIRRRTPRHAMGSSSSKE